MAKIRIGIIGGTGLDNPDIIENRKENVISTPYGIAEVGEFTTISLSILILIPSLPQFRVRFRVLNA
jgi:purine nucleoside phosphorylase